MPHLAICGGHPVRTEPYPNWPQVFEEDKEALLRVLESRYWGLQSKTIHEFETRFAAYCGAKHAVSCTNGTDAIMIALKAMGIGPGDEVIIPAYTFIATAAAVLLANAIPVMADIDPLTYNICPDSVRRLITPRTKALIPVHIAGNPADMTSMLAIAKEHGLRVLEDAAQAHGAIWNGKMAGTIGCAGTYSFQSSKNLSCGEGGAIVTNHDDLAVRLRTFVNCGRKPEVTHASYVEFHEATGNHRLGAFQASLLLSGLSRLEEQTEHRIANAEYLRRLLVPIEGVEMLGHYPETERQVFHLCIMKYNARAFQGLPRDRFIEAMQKEGIPCSSGYQPMYTYAIFQDFENRVPTFPALYKDRVNFKTVHCPECERICAEEAVWFFQRMLLGTRKDMEDIATAIQKIQTNAEEAVGS